MEVLKATEGKHGEVRVSYTETSQEDVDASEEGGVLAPKVWEELSLPLADSSKVEAFCLREVSEETDCLEV